MGAFSTKRPKSIEELKALQEQKAAEAKANKQLMEAQRLLEEQEAKAQAEMAKKDAEQKEKEAREQALEAMTQKYNLEKANKVLVEAVTRLPREGRESIIKGVLHHIMVESLWVDESVKQSSKFLPQTLELFESVIRKCDQATGTSLYGNMENTRFLSYINDIATETANRISDQILAEAKETKPLTIDFEMDDEGKDEINKKIADADPKSISKAIKEKVLEVIKEEKESGKVKAEMFQEIDEAGKDDEEGGDDVVESLVGLTMEATLEALEFHDQDMSNFRCIMTKIATLLPLADKESANGNTEKAVGCYEEAAEYVKQLLSLMPYQDQGDQEEATKLLSELQNHRMFDIRPGTGRAVRVEESSQLTRGSGLLTDAILEYCDSMRKALSNGNIVTETADQVRNRLTKSNADRMLMSSMGSTLFESQLIKNTCTIQSVLAESDHSMLDSEVQNAALLQTIVEYTMFETLNTVQAYHFDRDSISKIKAMQ